MSALPYVACALFTGVFGFATESVIKKNWLSRQNITKLYNNIGLLILFYVKLDHFDNEFFDDARHDAISRFIDTNGCLDLYCVCRLFESLLGSDRSRHSSWIQVLILNLT